MQIKSTFCFIASHFALVTKTVFGSQQLLRSRSSLFTSRLKTGYRTAARRDAAEVGPYANKNPGCYQYARARELTRPRTKSHSSENQWVCCDFRCDSISSEALICRKLL